MALIQVTPELLRGKAGNLRSLKSQHDDTMRQIKTLVDGLVEQWKGDAQTAFVQKFNSMQPTFNQFSEMLENFAKLMDASANDLEQADLNAKNRIANT